MSDLATFRDMLRINKHRLDDELEIQADVMDRISSRIAALNSQKDEAENDLKLCEAKLFRELKDNDEKITDKAADSAVKRDPERARAWTRANDAEALLRQWQGLYEAWKARGFSINKLCDLYAAQYFTKDSHSISSRSDRRRGEEAAREERRPYEGGTSRDEQPRTRRRMIEG